MNYILSCRSIPFTSSFSVYHPNYQIRQSSYATFRALALCQSDSQSPSSIRSNGGLTLETSALELFTVANLRYQFSW